MTIKQLEQTHWHREDVKSFNQLKASIVDVINSNLRLWLLRIVRQIAAKDTPFVPHGMLFVMRAQRYAYVDGRFQPVEPKDELVFWVVADARAQADDKVKAQLRAHGLNPDFWAIGSDTSRVMVLV